ncbi:hypothetical protein GWI33_007172 [Rhynchophorus ferrugineus]|uniref:Uncharacterized protein n=1 Tax=Rhynchophorus ferrugineus TaxID=354439 RepID=A0A834MII2_RHYFE|nr:hypothetical protein GWI33_007172 [Rhynchophorus ferrugineus]
MESSKEDKGVKPVKKHPFTRANFVSKMFFLWMLPLFVKGYKNDLLEDDLYPSMKADDSTILGDKLEKEWNKELVKRPKKPSLWIALGKVFGRELSFLGVCYLFIEICVRLAQPLFLAQLLRYYQPNSGMEKKEAYYYAGCIGIFAIVAAVCQHSYMLRLFHLGAKIRVATSTLVYRKSLKLSKSALADTTVGQMVNLISNDVGRFETVTAQFHNLWLAPIETIVVLILLYYNVGLTGVIGVVFMLCFIPIQMWLGKQTSIYRLATAIKTDERIRLMNEIISGIQVIKMYTWEIPFAKLVEISRRREISEIRKISIIRALMMSFNLFLNRTGICFCILAYFFTGHTLDAQYVYVLSSFYGILQVSVTMFFPAGVTQFAEANISVKRIREFLLYDEVDFDSSKTFLNSFDSNEDLKMNGDDVSKPVGIHLNNASVKWVKSQSDNSLENINMDLESGQLAAVIGPVGSGKTTLLHSILGELKTVSGSADITGKISYASQEPWLFVGTVRQNITFGQPFDFDRYYKVVKVCALERDFTLFPYGDRTIVGERGVSLSGGQRARINLARAVYKKADIYLLDDPLSAVDAHVGKQLFEDCINGYLRNKCVVLVTHQLQYLKNVEKIYLLGNKTVEHSGTYNEIQNSGKSFTQLLSELEDIMDEDEDDKESEKDEEDVKPIKRRRASTKEVVPKKDPEVEKESRGSGNISWAVYKSYFISGGHWCKILTLFLVFVTAQALGSATDYFLTIWVNMNQLRQMEAKEARVFNISTPENDTSIISVNDAQNTFKAINQTEFEYTPFQRFWLDNMDRTVISSFLSVLQQSFGEVA